MNPSDQRVYVLLSVGDTSHLYCMFCHVTSPTAVISAAVLSISNIIKTEYSAIV